jgi:uncharacterized GH25 family protein
MKLLSFVVVLLISSTTAWAHDFWAGVQGPADDGRVTVSVGFGHNFPLGEPITAEVMGERFDKPKMLGLGGTEIPLVPGGEPRVFVTEKPLSPGVYVALVAGHEGFSSRSPEGWSRKSKKDDPTVTSCSFGASYGKATISVGGAVDQAAASQLAGHKLEIAPQSNPAAVKVGKPFTLKVLFDGRPLGRAAVGAYFAGFTEDNSALAFSGFTDQEGLIDVIPLRPGQWLAKVGQSEPYPDPAVCDRSSYNASLAFMVAE